MGRRRQVLGVVAVGAIGLLLLAACDPIRIEQRALYTTQASVTISGSVEARDGDPLSSVTVNGVAATLDGTKFSAVIPVDAGPAFVPVLVTAHFTSGFSAIRRSTVARANGTSVTLVPKGAAIPNAMVTRLRPSALTKIGPGLASSVAFPVSQFAVAPVDLGGDIFDAQILAGGSTTLSTPTVALDVSGSNLRAVETYATVHQIVPVQVQGFTGPQNCTLDVTLGPVTGTSTYSLAPDASVGFRVTPAAAPTAVGTLVGTTGCTATSTQATSIDNAAAYVQSVTQQALVSGLSDPDGGGAGQAPLASGLAVRLAGIKLAGPVGGAGSGITLTAPIASIGASIDGVGVSDTPTYAASSVASGAPAQSSSLAFGPTTIPLPGDTGTPYDWSTGASVAAVNQLLAADTERGRLNRTVTTIGGQPLTFNQLDTIVGLGGPIAPDRALEVAVVPELAPAVTDAGGSGPTVGMVHVGGLRATITFSDNDEVLLDAVLDGDGPAVLGLAAGDLTLSVNGLSVARQDLLANPRGLTTPKAGSVLAALMGDLIAPLKAGRPLVHAPAVPGLTLSAVTTVRFGSDVWLFGSYS